MKGKACLERLKKSLPSCSTVKWTIACFAWTCICHSLFKTILGKSVTNRYSFFKLRIIPWYTMTFVMSIPQLTFKKTGTLSVFSEKTEGSTLKSKSTFPIIFSKTFGTWRCHNLWRRNQKGRNVAWLNFNPWSSEISNWHWIMYCNLEWWKGSFVRFLVLFIDLTTLQNHKEAIVRATCLKKKLVVT